MYLMDYPNNQKLVMGTRQINQCHNTVIKQQDATYNKEKIYVHKK